MGEHDSGARTCTRCNDQGFVPASGLSLDELIARARDALAAREAR